MTDTDLIERFSGAYGFLSNFHYSTVVLNGDEYPTVEHAFQSAKVVIFNHEKLDFARVAEREKIRLATFPAEAKRLGRKVKLGADWDDRRVFVMLGLLRQKFQDPVLGAQLLATGDAVLVEGNNWGDTFWGVVGDKGKNMLGVLLQIVRYELRKGLL